MSAKVYTCAACGKEEQWTKNWRWYGSLAMEEICPGELPCVCSDRCAEQFDRKVATGEVGLPIVALRGYSARVKRHGWGYYGLERDA
jgi:hypothetical protein